MEHLLLLVDELLHVQFAGLLRELYPGASDMHGTLDITPLSCIVTVGTDTLFVSVFTVAVFDVVGCWNVRLFHSSEWGTRGCRILIPNFLILEQLLSFLLLGLFGFPGDKNFFIVWGFEW